MGNITSVVNAFRRLGVPCIVSADRSTVRDAEGIVLPGVGAFGAAMQNLGRMGLDDVLLESARAAVPFLGICLGMQLLGTSSEELGFSAGLGLIEAPVLRL